LENILHYGLDLTTIPNFPEVFDGIIVGEYFADLLVEDCVLVELKAVKTLEPIHFAQCLSYLKAARLKLCLLMNFGNPKVEVKRIIQ
jgi:GxxExxY protein